MWITFSGPCRPADSMHHLCSCSVGQNIVRWLQLLTTEAGRCSSSQIQEEEENTDIVGC
jgi:hypothetical protein